MAEKQLKLGAILAGVGTSDGLWRDPQVPGDASIDIDWYRAQAQAAERAKFDFVFIVDSPYITPDSAPHFLNRLEPLTLLAAVAGVTKHIGLVATLTTSYNEPFNVARAFASLDLISHGRAGWNVVTTGLEGAAGNYGREEHFPHAVRYRRAKEHLEVVRALWDSYEDDAFPRDKASGVFLDKSKQHALNHRGEFFSVKGPLNISRSRQGHPVIFQAGGSEDGRQLAAVSADAIFSSPESFEEALEFARDIKARARAAGRTDEEILIFPGASVVIAETDEAAERKLAAQQEQFSLDKALVQLGRPFNYYDFSQHDLDAPFPDLGSRGENGYRSHAERIKRVAREEQLTLRQAALRFSQRRAPFVGGPETVADQIEHWFRAGALDGLNVGIGAATDLTLFIERVVPILQQRGLVRREYAHETLRENLGLRIPANRHTLARSAPQPARESLHQSFRELHAWRVANMDPARLQVNIDQRKTLVATEDRSRYVKVGERIESFSVPEVSGGSVQLDQLLQSGPAVLVFFRFEGCPACNLALPYYQRNLLPGLRKLGASLTALSPQVPERLVEIKTRHSLEFNVASDLNNALGERFGILYSFDEASRAQLSGGGKSIGEITGTGTWELPMPTVLVIDEQRIVRFVDVHPDWLLRTEAEPILAAVSAVVNARAEAKSHARTEVAVRSESRVSAR